MSVDTIVILGALGVGGILALILSFWLLGRAQRRKRRRRSLRYYYD